ncbi:MAG TPA: hypothetical protein VIL74_21575 [Pyrinomonadaceae bacterium]|jgi:hypothetical protein
MFKKLILTGLIICGLAAAAFAQKTIVKHAPAKTMLLGRHRLALQWVSWDYFGTATVTQRGGVFYLRGEQKSRKGGDFVKIDGTITEINAKDFKFDGRIVTQVSHINGGEPCTREGEMTFKITGTRRYWRLAEMTNPCDGVTDYVDIFFR